MFKYFLYLIISILLFTNLYLIDSRKNIANLADSNFDKGVKKSFTLGWLTGANQVRDFGDCIIGNDALLIMLKKDTTDFNYMMDNTK